MFALILTLSASLTLILACSWYVSATLLRSRSQADRTLTVTSGRERARGKRLDTPSSRQPVKLTSVVDQGLAVLIVHLCVING